jgi:hypothetical protein
MTPVCEIEGCTTGDWPHATVVSGETRVRACQDCAEAAQRAGMIVLWDDPWHDPQHEVNEPRMNGPQADAVVLDEYIEDDSERRMLHRKDIATPPRCSCDCGAPLARGDDFCSEHCEDIARREDADREEDALGAR